MLLNFCIYIQQNHTQLPKLVKLLIYFLLIKKNKNLEKYDFLRFLNKNTQWLLADLLIQSPNLYILLYIHILIMINLILSISRRHHHEYPLMSHNSNMSYGLPHYPAMHLSMASFITSNFQHSIVKNQSYFIFLIYIYYLVITFIKNIYEIMKIYSILSFFQDKA